MKKFLLVSMIMLTASASATLAEPVTTHELIMHDVVVWSDVADKLVAYIGPPVLAIGGVVLAFAIVKKLLRRAAKAG